MIDFYNQIRIERAPDYVFNVLADFESLPIWKLLEMQVRRVSQGEVKLGTTYHLYRKGDRRTLRIYEYKKDRSLGIETVENKPPRVNLYFKLEPDGTTRTLLNASGQIETGLPGLLEKMAAGKVRSMVDENLLKVKELLETGSTTMPGGQVVHLPED
jgi:hypothetical protein